ncbi:hypothetical protein B0T16DRAFT_495000 [Cercophora newfieldiana]|uniref:Uncharacterized protein n=1 Tax=Cercophora newfieldiana TaxID=92897 RepID=A0AA40CM67_9PEZI|nr:hypothetical protein B0T16DRAFT_495000 [Cercophora newfieldiana]
MKTQFLAVLAFVAPFAFATAASPRTDISFVGKPIHAPEILGSLSLLFQSIDSIPYDVLESGEEATDDWLVAHGLRHHNTPIKAREDTPIEERAVAATASLLDIINCAAAVSELILDAAVPVKQLLQIKKLIDALGGARKAAELLLKSKDVQDAVKLGGESLKELFEILMEFKKVKKACT